MGLFGTGLLNMLTWMVIMKIYLTFFVEKVLGPQNTLELIAKDTSLSYKKWLHAISWNKGVMTLVLFSKITLALSI